MYKPAIRIVRLIALWGHNCTYESICHTHQTQIVGFRYRIIPKRNSSILVGMSDRLHRWKYLYFEFIFSRQIGRNTDYDYWTWSCWTIVDINNADNEIARKEECPAKDDFLRKRNLGRLSKKSREQNKIWNNFITINTTP